MKGISGKVALITGGTTGIGRSTAVAFAKEGAKVVVTGRRAEEGEKTVALVKEAGGEARFVRADVSKPGDAEAMVKATLDAFGRLDFAVNNAGVEGEWKPTHEQTEANYDQVFGINVKGLWLSMKYEIPAILAQGGGAIVNTSSVAGLVGGFPGAGIYVASKHAVIGLTKTAALEYSSKGLRINAVCPAVIKTEMADRVFDSDAAWAQAAAMHPIGRVGQAEEVADSILYLCSDAASFITGHALPVDGGYLIQ